MRSQGELAQGLRSFWHGVYKGRAGYLFILPVLIAFATYDLYPKVTSIWWSFTNYRFLVPEETRFVGLGNYVEALRDRSVWIGARNALYFTVLAFAGRIVPPLFLAIVLDRIRREFFVSLCRVLYYIPSVVPGTLIFLLWKFIYAPSFGLLNGILVDRLHLFSERPLWILSESGMIPGIAAMGWWMALGGPNMLLFSVGLGTINKELYEAARIDGANELQAIRHICLPLLKPMFFIVVFWTAGSFGVLVEMMVMGIPGDASLTWALYAYNQAFHGFMRMGYASAVSLMFGIVTSMVAIVSWKLFRTERQ